MSIPDDKEVLPRYTPVDEYVVVRHRRRNRRRFVKLLVLSLLGYVVYHHWSSGDDRAIERQHTSTLSVERLQADYAHCSKLRSVAQDPSGPRERNARYLDGQKAVLIRNATVWTGEPATGTSAEDAHDGKGYSWVRADVLLEHGLIKRVEPDISTAVLPTDCEIWNAHGRLLTAGIVDMHSHAGDDSLPDLRGTSDTNELSDDITPYVRSMDAINPLDPQIQVIKSGGVTASLILPGSGNNIGGEAFVLKHAVGKANGRSELSAESMLADPEHNWRYMKMACGENAKRVYGRVGRDFGPFSRMGEAWYFRHAFEEASALVKAQNDWCEAADRYGAQTLDSYLPQDLHWESLGAVLRGQVHVNTHCYTVPDLEAFVRHTNEFRFPVRAFHHAHQTYLVPEILKRAYGNHTPAAALFADNMYYKAEAYVASEQAGKILYENGVTPVYVSDNPVLNAQHVVFEAAKAYRNGLPYHVALAGVTSASAGLLGLGERIGKVKSGFDADVVVWDSDPLSVGAAPVQVWIDGVPQFEDPVELVKPARKPVELDLALQDIKNTLTEVKDVVFAGVGRVMLPGHESHIVPPFTAIGSTLGLVEIAGEEDTQDGSNDASTFSRAADGLMFDTKGLKASYRHGVTRAIVAPAHKGGGHQGVSVGFRIGAKHALEQGAVWQEELGVHYTFTLAAKEDGKTPSISSAVDALRTKLMKAVQANDTTETSPLEDKKLRAVITGTLPLILTVHSADTIATLLRLKTEIETATSQPLRLIIHGGAESHLLAPELAASNTSVVLAPLLPYSVTWDQRRSLTGAPLTNGTAVDVLFAAGVRVGISTSEDWEIRDLDLLAGIAYANSGGRIGEVEALKMVSGNIYEMLGLSSAKEAGCRDEFVVYEGNPLEINSRVRAVADGRGELITCSHISSRRSALNSFLTTSTSITPECTATSAQQQLSTTSTPTTRHPQHHDNKNVEATSRGLSHRAREREVSLGEECTLSTKVSRLIITTLSSLHLLTLLPGHVSPDGFRTLSSSYYLSSSDSDTDDSIVIPDNLISVATLEICGFTSEAANEIFDAYENRDGPYPPSLDELAIQYITGAAYQHDAIAYEDDWAGALAGMGIKAEKRQAILDPEFTQLRMRGTAETWAKDIVQTIYDWFRDDLDNILTHTSKSAKGHKPRAGSPNPNVAASPAIRPSSSRPSSSSGPSQQSQPIVEVSVAVPATAPRNHTMIYKGGATSRLRKMWPREESNKIDLTKLHSTLPTDYSPNNAFMLYFAKNKPLAHHYAKYAQGTLNPVPASILHIAIPEDLLTSPVEVFGKNFQDLVFESRSGRKDENILSGHLQRFTKATLLVGSVSWQSNNVIARMKDSGDVKAMKLGTESPSQYAFVGEAKTAELNGKCRGMVWLEDIKVKGMAAHRPL
ncbi:hypothetical protein LTR12_006624 [Friedmanniomyces endolithicus]|nr:hypothetical protein LTR12_006624 [Friedmanniomyces endolithicus]